MTIDTVKGIRSLSGTLRTSIGLDVSDLLEELAWETEQPPTVAFVGEFNAGKSTLLNALIGADLLRSDILPATSAPTLLKFGKHAEAVVHKSDGSRINVGLMHLHDFSSQTAALSAHERTLITEVEIKVPCPLLLDVTLVDTPGFNSTDPAHKEATKRFVSQADALVWVFSALQAGSRSQLKQIEDIAKRVKPFAVINRIDELDDEVNLAEFVQRCANSLATHTAALVGVSARLALTGVKRTDNHSSSLSRISELQQLLADQVLPTASRNKRNRQTAKLLCTMRQLRAALKAVHEEAHNQDKPDKSLPETASMVALDDRFKHLLSTVLIDLSGYADFDSITELCWEVRMIRRLLHCMISVASRPSELQTLCRLREEDVLAQGTEIGFVDVVDDGFGNTNISETSTLHVQGWAADTITGSPVTRVDISVDEKVVGQATLNIPRPDVAAFHGKHFYADSGWTFTMPAAHLTVGMHVVTAAATGPSGTAQLVTSHKVQRQGPSTSDSDVGIEIVSVRHQDVATEDSPQFRSWLSQQQTGVHGYYVTFDTRYQAICSNYVKEFGREPSSETKRHIMRSVYFPNVATTDRYEFRPWLRRQMESSTGSIEARFQAICSNYVSQFGREPASETKHFIWGRLAEKP